MSKEHKMLEMLRGFDNAMLVTHSVDNGLSARPMAIAKVDDDGSVWFVSDQHSGKMIELAANSSVGVTMQNNRQFVSLSGSARIIDDRDIIGTLWNEMWRVWFPDGKDDPSIRLLHILPEHGEYWDRSGLTGIQYMVKAGAAWLQGETPKLDAEANAKVSMDSVRK